MSATATVEETETETKSAICSECGTEFEYEPAYITTRSQLVGAECERREMMAPRICETCEPIIDAREKQYELERQAQVDLDRFVSRVKGSELPKTFMRVPYPENTPDALREWGAGKIQGVCLTGEYGVGKTHLAAAATWDRLHREPIRWVRVAQLLTQLRAGFGDSESQSAKQVIAGTKAIVLDDLDKVNPTEFGKEVLFCAIDGRVQEGTPLLVTTNLSLGEISDRLGGAVASRLAGYCRVVRVEGRDRRLGS